MKCEACQCRRTKLHQCLTCRKKVCGCCSIDSRRAGGRVCCHPGADGDCQRQAIAAGGSGAIRFRQSGDAFAEARNRATRGHKSWLVWRGVDGDWFAGLRLEANVKAAMLAAGTQGKFYHVLANEHVFTNMSWRMGVIMLHNLRGGHLRGCP